MERSHADFRRPVDGQQVASSAGGMGFRGLALIKVRDPLYFLGYGVSHIDVKKDPLFFTG